MLHGIRRNEGDAKAPSAMGTLLSCHQKIRHFTEVSRTLGEGPKHPPAEVAAAAASVIRYFTEALPKHSDDEDLSIAPRLLAKALSSEERAAVEAMRAEHPRIHAALHDLMPHWTIVRQTPEALAREAPAIAEGTARLTMLWDAHLSREEALVFPAMERLLSAEELAEIHAEMRARRAV